MKKVIIGLLSIFTIATSAGVFSAVLPVAHAEGETCPTCGKSEHYAYQYTKQEATCTVEKIDDWLCTDCGAHHEVRTPALGHSYTKEAIKGRGENVADGDIYDCTTQVTAYYLCSRCDAISTETFVYREPGSHTWGEWETTAATCTTAGSQTRSCTVCAESETQTIPALGHDFNRKHEFLPHYENIASGDIHDCTSTVKYYWLCTRCDAYDSNKAVTMRAGNEVHEWGEWQTVTAATCTTAGVRRATCTNGAAVGKCTGSKTETIPALGHTWGEWETSENGVKTRSCTVCAATETGEHVHTWGEWDITTAATCADIGVKVRTCTTCNQHETETIPATGAHDFTKRGNTLSDIVSGNIHDCTTTVTMAFRCATCDRLSTDPDRTYVYREAGQHEPKKYYHAPTCTESGSSGEQCVNCGKDLKSDYLPPLGHNFVDRVCSRCGLEADFIIRFYDYDGKKIDETTSASSEAIDFPSTNPERRGYSFIGWFYYDDSGEYVKVDKFQTVKSDMEIYAHYEAIYINVYITDSVTGKTTTYKILDNYTLAESLKPVDHSGYKFLGYTRDGANINFATNTPITEEYHLTANYEITFFGQILDFFKSLSIWTIVIIVIAVVVFVIVLRSNNGGKSRRRR